MDSLAILLVLVVVAAAVVAVVRARRRQRAREQAEPAPAPPRDPFADAHGNEDLLYGLKVGDVVSYHARDYLVRGSLRFDEDGYTWAEHLISDERAQYWLSVEDDEGIAVVLWQRVPLDQVEGEPGSRSVTYGAKAYRLQEQGSATFTAEGTTGTAPSGTADYVDYAGPDDTSLAFERFGQHWEISIGERVLPRTLNVYPTSSSS